MGLSLQPNWFKPSVVNRLKTCWSTLSTHSVWVIQGTVCAFWAATGTCTCSLHVLFLGCLCHLFQLASKIKESDARAHKTAVYPKLGAYLHWPKAAEGRGQHTEGPNTCTPKSTAQSCWEGYTWARRAGVINTKLRHFLRYEQPFILHLH